MLFKINNLFLGSDMVKEIVKMGLSVALFARSDPF
jgi:hypothetical protein